MTLTQFTRMLVLGTIAASIGTAAYANNLLATAAPYGSAVPGGVAQRTVELHPGTKYVNVEQGETVKFVAQGKAFTWNFDTFGTRPFELSRVAPQEVNVGNVVVYVSDNPLYTGGN